MFGGALRPSEVVVAGERGDAAAATSKFLGNGRDKLIFVKEFFVPNYILNSTYDRLAESSSLDGLQNTAKQWQQ
ncbi:hypothetical protein NQ318_002759 [Aromia moschata]|uniref:Uncharacterized protein n=1 Tax=Aromia moschata TaxID=1265417 RepID=A0AAV8XFT7_9CUCU|nr:hypothetical protein NQ318_002759 [Aromia moschata]